MPSRAAGEHSRPAGQAQRAGDVPDGQAWAMDVPRGEGPRAVPSDGERSLRRGEAVASPVLVSTVQYSTHERSTSHVAGRWIVAAGPTPTHRQILVVWSPRPDLTSRAHPISITQPQRLRVQRVANPLPLPNPPDPLPRRGLVVNEDTVANPRRQLSARHAAHLPPPTSPRAQTKVAAAWPAPAAPGGGCRASWQLRVAYPRLYTWRGRAGARSPLDAGEAGQVQVPRRRRRPLLLSPPPGAPASPPFVSVPDHPLPSLCLAVGAPAHLRCGGQPAPSLCGGC